MTAFRDERDSLGSGATCRSGSDLAGSKSHRCWSSGIVVLVDDAAEDTCAQESVCVAVVQGGGLWVGVRR
jgi:hypothetical protein